MTAAYKAGKKKTRAEQARSCGLVQTSEIIIQGGNVDLNRLVGSHEKLTTPAKVAEGVRDLLVDHIRNNKLILELCEGVAKSGDNLIECSKSKSKMEDEHQKEKFDQYFEFKRNIGSLKHFQVMAMNRGENVKALSVKVNIAPRAENTVKWRCSDLLRGVRDQAMKTGAVEDACSRLIFPLIVRRIRLVRLYHYFTFWQGPWSLLPDRTPNFGNFYLGQSHATIIRTHLNSHALV